MERPKKMIVLSTRVDEHVAATLKKLANEKEWTPSKYIEKVLREHVEKIEKPKRINKK
jgi:predicted transcriptional regulator